MLLFLFLQEQLKGIILIKEVNDQFSTFEHHECKEPFERLDHGGMKGAARAAARAWRRCEGCVHSRRKSENLSLLLTGAHKLKFALIRFRTRGCGCLWDAGE